MEKENVFQRKRFMYIYMAVFSVVCVFLLALMLSYAMNKTIIITDTGDEDISNDTQEEQRENISWNIKLTKTGQEIHIPFDNDNNEVSLDMDYLMKTFTVAVAASKDSFYISNHPYGNFEHVTEGKVTFDGQYIKVILKLDDIYDYDFCILDSEVLVKFEEFSEDDVVVFVDPGHGGSSKGNQAGKLTEKDLTLSIANAVKAKVGDKDYKVILSRGSDRSLATDERIQMVDAVKADYYIGIHLEADSEDTKIFGMKAEYNGNYYRNSYENVDFADALLRNVSSSALDKGLELVKADAEDIILKVLKIPSAVLYAGYLSNSAEAELLSDAAYIGRIADGIIETLDGLVEK